MGNSSNAAVVGGNLNYRKGGFPFNLINNLSWTGVGYTLFYKAYNLLPQLILGLGIKLAGIGFFHA